MIDRKALLADLQDLTRTLEADLRERAANDAETDKRLRAEWASAKEDARTGESYEAWIEDRIPQSAVAWILACVFVRFLEDNELLDRPYLSGPGPRRQLAMDHETAYFTGERAGHSERDYLLAVFRDVSRLPTMGPLLHPRHNPLYSVQLSADGARELVAFWRKIDPGTGGLVHDFADSTWTTRWLGDLYQYLSEYARKRYALLQTPDFVVTFILDRTLEPAIQEFGYREVRLIDPTCGSGHFLLDAFFRLVQRWVGDEPSTNSRELAQRALDQVFGVDLSPTVVAIARFRLIVEALRVVGVRRLDEAPNFRTNLAVGDSLLHGPRPRQIEGRQLLAWTEDDKLAHVYDTEDADELRRILGQAYHVVVGNPPYITPKDPALRQAYRDRYSSCTGKYSLGVPFTERFFDLALAGEGARTSPAGYVGMITSNSFMKRDYGKALIERILPRCDLTHVIDMSGAYVPGHGTPTVILLARLRRPVAQVVRAVRGISGEPSTPDDPARGLVWTAIVEQIDCPGSESAFVSVDDVERTTLSKHPWSIGGGGASELKERLDASAETVLGDVVLSVGPGVILSEDDAFCAPESSTRARRFPEGMVRPLVRGDDVRDWSISTNTVVLFPYSTEIELCREAQIAQCLWPFRTTLWARADFSNRTYKQCGRPYWEYHQIPIERNRVPLGIAFPFVATHNHFVFERGGRVFGRTAPLIKLANDSNEDDHYALLGVLNSSTGGFWLRQICYPKGGDHVGDEGARVRKTLWEERFEYDASKVKQMPLPVRLPMERPRRLDQAAASRLAALPCAVALRGVPTRKELDSAHVRGSQLFEFMVAVQEDLDWECYHLYDLEREALALPPERTPGVRLGERAFEIVMARKMAAGKLESRWFERHGSTPITEIPSRWPEDYREIVRRRIVAIEMNSDVALIEQPEYKRRWHIEQWEDQEKRALRAWLVGRLKDSRYWPDVHITTCARLADRLGNDLEFRQVADLYRGRTDFDMTELVVDLVEGESVPYLSALRYSENGAKKRFVWERTWSLQRREDAGEKVEIDVPPKYAPSDFAKQTYWHHRDKLDVPKEGFIIYPLAGTDADPTSVIGWANWDYLQQAKALASWIVERQTQDGWGGDRLTPLLAGLLELLPWLRQWHNDVDPDTGLRLGDYFTHWVEEEARKVGATLEELRSWTPPAKARKLRKKKGDS